MQAWQEPSDEHGEDEAQQESASGGEQQQASSAGSLQQTERAQNQRDLNHKVKLRISLVLISLDSLVIEASAWRTANIMYRQLWVKMLSCEREDGPGGGHGVEG